MSKHWYFLKNEQQYGPISAAELKQKAASGELGPNDSVRPEDRQNWVKAATVKGLFTAPLLPPTSSVPFPPPTGSADSQSESTHPNNNAQRSVQPFIEWYQARWLSRKSGRFQVVVWAAFGFAWIPYWYFLTATPQGSLRDKWASLGHGRQVAYVVLTSVLCLVLLRTFVHRSDGSPQFNGLPAEVTSHASGQIPHQPSFSGFQDNSQQVGKETVEQLARERRALDTERTRIESERERQQQRDKQAALGNVQATKQLRLEAVYDYYLPKGREPNGYPRRPRSAPLVRKYETPRQTLRTPDSNIGFIGISPDARLIRYNGRLIKFEDIGSRVV